MIVAAYDYLVSAVPLTTRQRQFTLFKQWNINDSRLLSLDTEKFSRGGLRYGVWIYRESTMGRFDQPDY